MLEKEFVPYEQALALKELGFNEPCLAFYNHQSILIMMAQENEEEVSTWKNSYVPLGKQYAAPTFSQAFRWFREKHGLYHIIHCPTKDVAIFTITGFGIESTHSDTQIKSYEEAELACLIKLIEIAKD